MKMPQNIIEFSVVKPRRETRKRTSRNPSPMSVKIACKTCGQPSHEQKTTGAPLARANAPQHNSGSASFRFSDSKGAAAAFNADVKVEELTGKWLLTAEASKRKNILH
jgi:hypothetical protein